VASIVASLVTSRQKGRVRISFVGEMDKDKNMEWQASVAA
jgi:hypothetical protein